MSARVYKLTEGSLSHRFALSRAKIQVMGGGFANGKTSGACIKALEIAKSYPGANILLARATYPKLKDTLMKEFLKWCPKHWIKSFPKSDPPTCELVNGTTINFRYIAQQGKASQDSTTSNLLSANYDAVFVDQIEDPEITEKDFYDLLGRLRGMASYIGDDPTMPRTGPRWFVITCNPTRNWFYRKVVRPLHEFKATGRRSNDLIVDSATGQPIVELFEGSTYENAENLEPDYIATLEATYRGQMRERFLLGRWAAYEGLVYPEWNDDVHVLPHDLIVDHYNRLMLSSFVPSVYEAYDHGIAVPSCYLWGFADDRGNVFLVDGHYAAETSIEEHAHLIKATRELYDSDRARRVLADPSLFRRHVGDKRTVGKTVADLFWECGIGMEPGNNDKMNGVHKVKQYLTVQKNRPHPIYEGIIGSPCLYVSDRLDWFSAEINDYYWKKNTAGEQIDEPIDKNDHALDTTRYILSRRPKLAVFVKRVEPIKPWMKWSEYETTTQREKAHRYG